MKDDLALFVELLPPDLIARAFRAGNELAWARSDAIEAISRIEHEGKTILGVDVWSPSPRGPIVSPHFVYDWTAGARNTIPGWPTSAMAFVKTFDWDPQDSVCKGLKPYFVLTVDE